MEIKSCNYSLLFAIFLISFVRPKECKFEKEEVGKKKKNSRFLAVERRFLWIFVDLALRFGFCSINQPPLHAFFCLIMKVLHGCCWRTCNRCFVPLGFSHHYNILWASSYNRSSNGQKIKYKRAVSPKMRIN